jgi:ComF family protein
MRAVLDLLLPSQCAACARLLDGLLYFCAECQPQLEHVEAPWCPSCGEPQTKAGPCPRCIASPPPMQRSFAPFVHHGPLARAIHRWKYEDHPELTRSLAALLVQNAEDFLRGAPDVMVALPLHEHRFRERRYDQARLLTEELAKLTQRKVLDSALRRARATRRQVGLSEADREENVRGAFDASSSACLGQSILLVDDVLTTGATVRSAASSMRTAGAISVWVLTLARAYTA